MSLDSTVRVCQDFTNMNTLHQKRQKFASVLEKACKQSTSSCPSSRICSPEKENNNWSWSSPSSLLPWTESISSTPLLESLHTVMSWPVSLLSNNDIPPSSQLSPCWPNDSAFCCPWNSTSMDLDFLEADTPEKMTSQATSPGAEISQTSMDLLDFLDDQNHTISRLGACMNIDDPFFNSINNPDFSLVTDPKFAPQQEWLKNDTWMNDAMTSDSDLDDLFMHSKSAKMTPNYQARLSTHQSARFYSDMAKSLSTHDYFHHVADRVTKKAHTRSKELSPDELYIRKERNRLRSKAYRLRRKMQYESMKNEVTQTKKELQAVQEQIHKLY
ncbi:uncharacterized protein [Asterias amurensis]|uniref:uncharacterized protein isoform X2 n=1 Tax=Asterias amurensis TaxID=7602 RepID=UPI003AB3388C